MTKAKNESALLSIALDRTVSASLQTQLADHLRRLILRRALMPGDRLPSSRALAAELSVSRITTSAVYDQLVSEGYLEGKPRSGVFVDANLLDFLPDPDKTDPVLSSKAPRRALPRVPFEISVPEINKFPFKEWSKHHDKVWRTPDPILLHSPDRRGFAQLRLQISEHLAEWRGVTCDADQIVITSGVVEGLEIIAEAVLGKDDGVYIEDPAYPVVRKHLTKIGVETFPILTDEHGFDTTRMKRSKRHGRAALVTPSRQFPLGMTMPLNRRLELLRWAEANNAMIMACPHWVVRFDC